MVTATLQRRPAGVTVVALLLFWICIGAVGYLVKSRSMAGRGFALPGTPAAELAVQMSSNAFAVMISIYGLSALIAALGAWHMRAWMARAFLVWSVTVVVLGSYFLTIFPREVLWGGYPAAIAFVCGMAFVLWSLYRYVDRAAKEVRNAAL